MEELGKILLLLVLAVLSWATAWLYGEILALRAAIASLGCALVLAARPNQKRSKGSFLDGLMLGEWIEAKTNIETVGGFYHGHQGGLVTIKEKQDVVTLDLNRIIFLRRRRAATQMDEGLWPEGYSRITTQNTEDRYPLYEI